ncbi:RNA polymerase-binding transcription factor DksA [compost metagenome]
MTRDELLSAPGSDYMNEAQLAFFKALLLAQLEECKERVESGKARLADLERPIDVADVASIEEERMTLLHMIDRDRRMLPAFQQALARIDDDSYGWCDETGEPIGLQRLLLSPTTTLSVEAKQRQELIERHMSQA